MICRWYVQNFLSNFLPNSLSIRNNMFIPLSVNTYLLSISMICSLSTISIFGANLISLYLFLANFSGKVKKKHVIYD